LNLGDARHDQRKLAENSVHLIVTSPPYAKRYEILLTKLVREYLYDSARFLMSNATDGSKGLYKEPAPELSFQNFVESRTHVQGPSYTNRKG